MPAVRPLRARRQVQSRKCLLEPLESRQLLTGWTNPFNSRDTTGDGLVAPVDALVGINELNQRSLVGPGNVLPDRALHPLAPFYDVNSDGLLSPVDIIAVFNLLNAASGPPVVVASLARDTEPGGGGDGTDGLTSDFTILGQATHPLGIRSVRASLNGGQPFDVAFDAAGQFSFQPELATNGGSDGPHRLAITAMEARGSVTTTDVQFTLDTVPPSVTFSSTPGRIANTNVAVQGHVTDTTAGLFALLASQDGEAEHEVSVDQLGRFSIDFHEPLDGTADGVHTIQVRAIDAAGNVSAASNWSFTLDTQAPLINLAAPLNLAAVSPGAMLTGQVTDATSRIQSLRYELDGRPIESVAFDPVTGAFAQRLTLDSFTDGPHTLSVVAMDEAGNRDAAQVDIDLDLPLRILHASPGNGAREVGVTFRPELNFSQPIDVASLNAGNFFVTFAGHHLPTTIVPGGDGMSAWLFPDETLPGAATIELHVVGDTILAADNAEPLDADGDGQPGGTRIHRFTTVGVTPIPGTSLVGMIVDPGPDLLPFTADDFDPGPDGVAHTDDDVFLLPISGVDVHVIGAAGTQDFTDSQGNFVIGAVPPGNVKVVIDGRTATSPPAGAYFPEMVMDARMTPGAVNHVMPRMPVMYLPRIETSILEPVSAAAGGLFTVRDEGAPGLTPDQRQRLSIDVRPHSLIGLDGQPLDDALVGISTVPAELVVDMLPPGVLQHTFDITIQAPNVAIFSTPAAMSFPNVFGAEPGTKLNFLSFDHTTGRLEIEGTATVSGDGLSVRTDPGTGITKPGWHGLTPGGGPIDDQEPPPEKGGPGSPQPDGSCPVDNSPEPDTTEDIADEFIMAVNSTEGAVQIAAREIDPETPDPDFVPEEMPGYKGARWGEFFRFEWEANTPPDPPMTDNESGCTTEGTTLGIKIKIEVEGPLDKFAETVGDSVALESGEYTLVYGDKLSFAARPLPLSEMVENGLPENVSADDPLRDLNDNFLVGAKVKVTATYIQGTPGGGTASEFTYEVFPYIFVDATDDDESDNVIKFEHTSPGFTRTKPLVLHRTLPESARPELAIVDDDSGSFSVSQSGGGVLSDLLFPLFGKRYEIQYAPAGIAPTENTARLELTWPESDKKSHLDLLGRRHAPQQAWHVIDFAFEEALRALVEDTSLPAAEQRVLDFLRDPTAPFRLNSAAASGFINEVKAKAAGLLQPFSPALTQGSAFGPTLGSDFVALQFADSRHLLGDSFLNRAEDWPLDFGQLRDTIVRRDELSASRRAYRLAQAINDPQKGGAIMVNVREHLQIPSIFSAALLGNALAHTLAHEIGHHLGLVHTVEFRSNPDGTTETRSFDPGDVLAQGLFPLAVTSFHSSREAGFLSLGMDWTLEDAERTLDYYRNWYRFIRRDAGVNVTEEHAHLNVPLDVAPIEEPLLDVRLQATGTYEDVVEFPLAEPGGSPVDVVLELSNFGLAPLNVGDVWIDGGDGAFSIVGAPPVGMLPPDPLVFSELTLRFAPAQTGSATARLTIASDALNETVRLRLVAAGRQAGAALSLDLSNNFLPPVAAGQGATENPRVATIVNHGAQPLVISAIEVADAGGPFELLGLPADLASHPITLEFGEAFDLGARFAPREQGLLRGEVRIVSNDADSPVTRFFTTGTSEPDDQLGHWGNDFVALETPKRPGSIVLRGITDDGGSFEFFLPPEEYYHIAFFDPATGMIAHGWGLTAASGASTNGTAGIDFAGSRAPDRDGDGLPDDVEFAVGSDPLRRDTDGDGVDDYTALMSGGTPVGGAALPLGLVNVVPLVGEATRLVVESSADDLNRSLAYVATGTGGGLAIVDVTDPAVPLLLGQLPLTGENMDVAVDPARGIAAVASREVGVHLVDITDPVRPVLLDTFELPQETFRVELFNGQPIATQGSGLARIDPRTRQVVQTLDLERGTLTDLARDGDQLYTIDFFAREWSALQVVALDAAGMTRRGLAETQFGSGQLFAGDGAAFAMAPVRVGLEINTWGGFSTFDVNDPDNPSLISRPDNFDRPGPSTPLGTDAVVANGSGLAVLVGIPDQEPPALDLLNVSDLQVTDDLLTRFTLPAAPRDVALASGLAFTAAGAGGLQVVNYLGRDLGGQAPAVTIRTPATDKDAGAEGLQVHDGDLLVIDVDLDEDFQTRHVDLLINGLVAARDLSFPFSFQANAPLVNTPATLAVQVRAIDSGGNVGTSNVLDIDVLPDAPRIIAATVRNDPTGSVLIVFDQEIDVNGTGPQTFVLTSAGPDEQPGTSDDVDVPLEAIEFDVTGTQVTLSTAQPLPVQNYRLTLLASGLRDLGGNPLDGEYTGSFPTGDDLAGGDFVFDFRPGGSATRLSLFPAPRVPLVPLDSHQAFHLAENAFGVMGGNTLLVDVNGDGRPDLVRPVFGRRVSFEESGVVVSDVDVVSVLLAQADGSFADPLTLPVGPHPRLVAAADVNGDQHIDLVTVNVGLPAVDDQPSVAWSLSVLLGRGDGTFEPEIRQATGRDSNLLLLEIYDIPPLVIGEFTGDSQLDLALLSIVSVTVAPDFSSSELESELLVLAGNGDGTFQLPQAGLPLDLVTTFVGLEERQLFAADLNGDQRPDLVTPEHVLLANGDGTFAVSAFPGPAGGRVEAVRDLTGDGVVDAMYVVPPNTILGTDGTTMIYQGTGDGSFQPLATTDYGFFAFTTRAFADFDGDGVRDILAQGDFNLELSLGNADLTFQEPQGIHPLPTVSGQLLQTFVTGDFNQDGHADVIVTRRAQQELVFLLGRGDGTFDTPPPVSSSSGVLLHVDGDQHLDMAATVGNLRVNLGHGDGTFGENLVSLGGSLRIDYGEMSGDGVLDAAVLRNAGGGVTEIWVYTGVGDGFFENPQMIDTLGGFGVPGFSDVRLADIDGDGALDVVTVDRGGLSVRLGHGDGTFAAAVRTASGSFHNRFLRAGDFNGDQRDDLALLEPFVVQGDPARVSIYLGNVDGTLTPAGSTPEGLRVRQPWLVQDLNNDGLLDVATAATVENRPAGFADQADQLLLFLGHGDGTLRAATQVAVDNAPLLDIEAGDINGDELVDLLFLNEHELAVLLGEASGGYRAAQYYDTPLGGCAVALGDLNGDDLLDALLCDRVLLNRGL